MRYFLIINLILFCLVATRALAARSEQNISIGANKNETICQQKFTLALFNQQRIFSSAHSGPEKRRIAERKIEAARERFNSTASYCDGYQYLMSFKPENLKSKAGDAQFD